MNSDREFLRWRAPSLRAVLKPVAVVLAVLLFPATVEVLQTLPVLPRGTCGLLVPLLILRTLYCPGFLVLLFMVSSGRSARERFLYWGCLAAIPASVVFSYPTRMFGMSRFVNRSEKLVSAIHQYEADHNQPPPDLDALVPRYLPKAPWTGMPRYPDYRYIVRQDTGLEERPWQLFVSTTSHFMEVDVLVYRGDEGHSWGTPIGDWEYRHD